MTEERSPLRLITYLVPSIPVELFETIADYLESELKRETLLTIESRFYGPQSSRSDLFESNAADLAFISGASYQDLKASKNANWELLPVGAVHCHPTKGNYLGYFSDIVVNKEVKERSKNFLDLRGSNWATNDPSSLSGHIVMLKLLREKGENVSFFGSILPSGSHAASIQMVSLKKADVTTVDSVTLACALQRNPALANDVEVFDSVGPLPPHPIMVRASMPAEQKQAIADALLRLHEKIPWNERCAAFSLVRFVKTTEDIYYSDRETREQVVNLSAAVRYY